MTQLPPASPTPTAPAAPPAAKTGPARRRVGRVLGLGLGAAALAAATVAVSWADDRGARTPLPPLYVEECAACHAPYPARMLPARSWARIMDGLPSHYGSDASLDADTHARIAAWLQAHAGSGKHGGEAPPEDRITRSARFERKHRDIDAATWKLPSVKSAANCAACHLDTDVGRYSDDRLRMPEGISAAQRRRWGD